MHNDTIAEFFNRIADLLEIQGANPFRVRAYRSAARTLMGLSMNVSDMVKAGEELSELPGIGKDLAAKIVEIVQTGSLKQLKSLVQQTPAGLIELMRIPGLGPRRIQALRRNLGISSLSQLERAVKEKRVQALKGFGRKTEAQMLRGIEARKIASAEARLTLPAAERIIEPLMRYLKQTEGMQEAEAAGSYRRRKESVGDLDILLTCEASEEAMDRFTTYEGVKRVVSKGTTRSSVILHGGFQVDLRVVAEESYGAALQYFTGSKAHSIAIRSMAEKRGLKINEYGVFRAKSRIAGQTEGDVYARLQLPYIEPELREDRGEIAAAQEGRLPRLVSLGDIRGDLHCHTDATDGNATIDEMAEAARERGYQYVAVSDHSRRVAVARGMDEKRLRKQIESIDRLNGRFRGVRLLKSIEVDILADGTLDLPDSVLRELDLVVCAIHYNQAFSRSVQTERVLRAMKNPLCHILAHPTGRILGEREPYEIDMERIMGEAKKEGWFLEINAQPQRLDLSDTYCRMAREMGVKLALSTDAHSVADLDFMRYGLWQARRGWIEAKDVLNTRPWNELRKLLRRV